MEYVFTLKYRLTEDDRDHERIVERLGEAGCDDALVGIGVPGRIALEFAREADNAQDAVRTALADVDRAVPSAHLIEAAPDLVGLTEIAETVGVSRQNMRKLMLTHANSFPAPMHAGNPSIWHLAEVLGWLDMRGGYDLDPALQEVARVTMEVNLVKEARRVAPETARSLGRLIA